MTIHICITNQEVTYLLKALKERQENAKGKQERLSLANIRDIIEHQTGRCKSGDVGTHLHEELDKQQREKKGETTP